MNNTLMDASTQVRPRPEMLQNVAATIVATLISGVVWQFAADGGALSFLTTVLIAFGTGLLYGLYSMLLLHPRAQQQYNDLAQLRRIFNTMQNAYFLTTTDGQVKTINPTAIEIYGYPTVEELLKVNVTDLYADPEDRAAFLAKLAEEKSVKGIELRMLKKDGTLIDVDLNARYVYNDSGEVIGLEGLIQDITERKAAERALLKAHQETKEKKEELENTLRELRQTQGHLIHSEKMAALGKITAGIAHEVNNPIGAVQGAVDVISRCADKVDEAVTESETIDVLRQAKGYTKAVQILRDNSQNIRIASERIAQIVASLKNFARLDEATYQRANVLHGLESALTLIQHDLGSQIEIEQNLAELPEIYCNPSEVNQVLMTILTNAIEAIPGEGKITIAATHDAENLTLSIADTGNGIEEEKLRTLFDLSFTAKTARVGMGMGLPTAYNIIQNHGGRILVESTVGEGTCFSIVLPLSAEPKT